MTHTVPPPATPSSAHPRGPIRIGPGGIREREVLTPRVLKFQTRDDLLFLRGPVPWAGIVAAQALHGAAVLIFLLAHHQTTIAGKPWVRLPTRLLQPLGIDRPAKSRAVAALERAGLIKVKREKGCALEVALTSRRSAGGQES